METHKALTRPQRLLLLEAARRYKEFNHRIDEPLTKIWSGLGTAKEYRCVEDAGLMQVVPLAQKETPKTIYWWKLTPIGAAIVRVLVSALTVDQIVTELRKEKGL